IQFRHSTPLVGGTWEDPWSDSTWLLWIKKQIDEFSEDPTLTTDPATRYGPPFEVEREPATAAAWRSFLDRYSEKGLAWEELRRRAARRRSRLAVRSRPSREGTGTPSGIRAGSVPERPR